MKKIIMLTILFGLGALLAHGELLSSWTFEEGSGSSTADVVGSNDMTLMGSAAFSAGAMSFNGTNSYLTTAATDPDLNRGTNNLIIKFDLKLTSASTDTFILNKRNPAGGEWISVEISTSGYLKFNALDTGGGVANNTVYAGTKPVVGQWDSWEIIIPNDGPAVIKRNGVVDTHSNYLNETFAGNLSNTAPLELGRWSGDGNYLDGELDDVSISVIPEPEPNLVGSTWDFEEGTGYIAADAEGSNDLTLVNGASFSTVDPGAGSYSMSFDGVDDYLTTDADTPDLNPGTNDFTIAFKVNIDVRQRMFILNKRNPAGGERLAVEISSASGYLKLNLSDTNGGIGNLNVFAQTPLNTNQWYDVEIRVPRNAPAEIWVDGVNNTHSDYDDVVIGGDLSIEAALEVGRWSGDGYYFHGQIDDLSMYADVPVQISAYDSWIAGFGLTGDAAAQTNDVEPDGLNNLLEYAFGGNPTNDDYAAVAPVGSIVNADGTNWLYYTHNERTDDASLIYSVRQVANLVLGGWQTNGIEFVGESGAVEYIKSVTNRTDTADAARFITVEVGQ